ncbi:hypothetical protein AOCH_000815 [Aspergillus ochraceoroseus]|uniref:Uncharacterized protein n=1 Tax=Aspergillus ochraceoroseus TaxID=138278 RepID=A0A0F8U345_9EURO|nr:hypothetical protein AOCH_000815 [Aspergillus ochraceoroseus]
MAEVNMEPATANRGHITKPDPLENTVFTTAITAPARAPTSPAFGHEAVSDRIRGWSVDAERNQPYVKKLTNVDGSSWGNGELDMASLPWDVSLHTARNEDDSHRTRYGRRAMFTLAWILGGLLLALDSQRDGDGVTTEIARRWIIAGEIGVGDTVWRDIVYPGSRQAACEGISEESLRWDCRIAWGEELTSVASGHRSMKL